MSSNFEFLKEIEDAEQFVGPLETAELMYANQKYQQVPGIVRNVPEGVARYVLKKRNHDFSGSFFEALSLIRQNGYVAQDVMDILDGIRRKGNKVLHDAKAQVSKDDAYEALFNLHKLMYWFVYSYCGFRQGVSSFKEPVLYTTSAKTLVYSFTADDLEQWPQYAGRQKIGKATYHGEIVDTTPNSQFLHTAALKRIKSYAGTMGVKPNIEWTEAAYREVNGHGEWFDDHAVHDVLDNSNIKKDSKLVEGAAREWYVTDVDTVKNAIAAVRAGKSFINAPTVVESKIKLRPEQQIAIDKTERVFKTKKNDDKKMLWNAKMRFGKTLSALQLIKNQQYERVLIMTHRPVVRDSWFEDFDKLSMPGYRYGSKQKHDASLEQLVDDGGKFLYFASMQDLRGSEWAGGKAGDKNELIAKLNWNLVIIDEAHEGTQTGLAQSVIKGVVKDTTRVLELSGTPFNLIDEYEPDQVFTWDYTMEQQAKARWNVENPDEVNPYAVLPKVSMFTFEMKDKFEDNRFLDFDQKAFNFHEFFKVDDKGRFVYETKVNQFLNNITSPSKDTNFPYSTEQFRNELRHTLWLLPSVDSAKALKTLMEKHPVFGMGYTIVNVVDDGKEDGASEGDLERVRAAITKHPAQTKTITLTVRKLTTGVNIPQWTGVMFLSNTNSAMQYLQAAFRAQTPYADKELGMKTDCYIFDFAPDRALNVMAASSQLNTGAGKLQTDDQKEKMGELLNFLPIIGEQDQGMALYNVDSLMTQLKKVYAERAVRTGFDDDSLYNDELLKMDEADLKDFNDLKAEIGTTKAQKKPNTINVNHQGLTDEEYNKAEKTKKKNKKDLTPKEQELLEKERALKKQRKTMISILRSISIRIPMMIYGMDIPIEKNIDIQTFVDKVDAESWAEFMPKGVDKAKFKKFSKYYDANIFIEAGRIIRQRVKRMDRLEPLKRTADIGELFGTFKNPYKETVLTPWRVVNMQLGKTIGGYSYFDPTYNYTSIDGVDATHWVDTEMTKDIFKRDTRILEINSKTGLYPLYVATSLYYQEQARLNERTGGRFTAKDEDEIWRNILAKNIFAIAKTPMAKRITNRTLCGYHEFGTNVVYVDGVVEKAKNSNDETVQHVLDAFKERITNQMKFDVVIGNPPYQETERGDSKSKKSIYQYFMELSYQLSEKSVMITPARFLFKAGDTSSIWNEKMLNDPHLRVVMFEKHSGNIFPKTSIKGGVAITLRDTTKKFGKIGTFTQFDELRPILDKVRSKRSDTLNSIGFSRTIYRLTDKLHQDFPDAVERLSSGHKYDMSSNIMKLLPEVFYENKPDDGNQYIRILGKPKDDRIEEWIRRDYVTDRLGLDKYNVFLASAIGSGEFGEPLSDMYIAEPGVGHTETFISIGAFDTRLEAESAEKYLKTKFARTMLGIWKVTQNGPISTYREIPVQNFAQNSDIDWKAPISDIDNQLFAKYELSDDEVQFINTHVEEMN